MKVKVPDILLEQAERLEKYYKEKQPSLAPLVKQCFLNTMDTTIKKLEDDSFFVITGDIPAMWLRDSAAQVRHYIRYANGDPMLSEILEGIIAKQAELVMIDPYANAFNAKPDGSGHKDDTVLNDYVWERKYETDSLCAPLYLLYHYWKETKRENIFTTRVKDMIQKITEIFKKEQDHEKSDYSFKRYNCAETDTLMNNGRGNSVRKTGMTWSAFRPSDDRCTYGYLIPANMMAVKALRYGEEICKKVYKDEELSYRCFCLSEEINEGIKAYGIVNHPAYGSIYAYETDGWGQYNLMDDANAPSLLSIPYIGYCSKEDAIYQNTRKFILSKENPYYAEGMYAKGIGSPHTPKGYIWHIGITMQALTSNNREEIEQCLSMLANTHARTNYMHEAFHPDNPKRYTRSWFAWANSLFAELADRLYVQKFWGE